MKLKTNIKVEINTGVKAKVEEFVEGYIESVSWLNGFEAVGVNYVYSVDGGEPLHKGSFIVESTDIDTLYDSVKSLIPSNPSHRRTVETKFYLGFAVEMANTLEVDMSKIDLIY